MINPFVVTKEKLDELSKESGRKLDRTDIVFVLKQDDVNKNVYTTIDGITYFRNPSTGSLRRITPKKKGRK